MDRYQDVEVGALLRATGMFRGIVRALHGFGVVYLLVSPPLFFISGM